MAPHAKTQEADAADGANHRSIAEDRLAGKSREQMRGHTHSRQNRDVHLGMSEEPEQVLPQERRTALVPSNDLIRNDQPAGNEETGAREAIEQKQDARREQYAESQQCKDRGYEPGPACKRHAPERHALGTEVNQSGDEVERAHERRTAEDRQADNPQSLAGALT